ncbi:MAG: hypothetical protein Q8T08_11015 [Ignavibacteria bacterium]|nr:hypothetical protein [Ignavibacteria bacterium]
MTNQTEVYIPRFSKNPDGTYMKKTDFDDDDLGGVVDVGNWNFRSKGKYFDC